MITKHLKKTDYFLTALLVFLTGSAVGPLVHALAHH